MFGFLRPGFEGTWKPDRLVLDFPARLAARVRSGLLPGASPRRNRYEITAETSDLVRFRSAGFWTDINIGWNEVEVCVDRRTGDVYFAVRFWAWARYCVALGLALGVILTVLVVLPVLLEVYLLPETFYPAREEVLGVALPIMIFWCLVWPWILVAIHRIAARKGFFKLLEELNADAAVGLA